jgi:hypothetical protein
MKQTRLPNKKVAENIVVGAHKMEQDHEVQMARSQLYSTAKNAIKLHELLKSVSEAEGLEGWVQAKITKASDYLESVFNYMHYDAIDQRGDTLDMGHEVPLEEFDEDPTDNLINDVSVKPLVEKLSYKLMNPNNLDLISGSSLVGIIPGKDLGWKEVESVLGSNTYAGDNRIKIQYVIKDNGIIYTLYDYKDDGLVHVGGNPKFKDSIMSSVHKIFGLGSDSLGENASGGSTSSGAIATVPMGVGGVRRRGPVNLLGGPVHNRSKVKK